VKIARKGILKSFGRSERVRIRTNDPLVSRANHIDSPIRRKQIARIIRSPRNKNRAACPDKAQDFRAVKHFALGFIQPSNEDFLIGMRAVPKRPARGGLTERRYQDAVMPRLFLKVLLQINDKLVAAFQALNFRTRCRMDIPNAGSGDTGEFVDRRNRSKNGH
jgi:hypothetical protein